MKECHRCHQLLPEDDFSKNGKHTRYICKHCEVERVRQGQLQTVEYIHSLKHRCSKCGYNANKYALEFHHINPEEKDSSMGKYTKRMFSPKVKELIDTEVAKCIILCANCHREEHYPNG